MIKKLHGKPKRQRAALNRLYKKWEASKKEHAEWVVRTKVPESSHHFQHDPAQLLSEINDLRRVLGMTTLTVYLLNNEYYIYDNVKE